MTLGKPQQTRSILTNKKHPDKRVPEGLFESSTSALTVCEWLCKFVLETRQENGSPYPPKSLYSILCGLYRISRSNDVDFNFLDKNNPDFRCLHRTLDSLFRDLHSKGIWAQAKSAQIISFDDEQLLWDKGIFSFDNPQNLQRLVFFYVGLQMSLRGCQEHHELKVEQFTRFPADKDEYTENTYYEYREFISKNNQHRYKDLHYDSKTVKVFAIVDSSKCLVKILDNYLAKLPANPKTFYLRPASKVSIADALKSWYITVPIGVNTIKKFLPSMCAEAGLTVQYTNHSLRATSASRMFAKNVPEKIIKEKTGHRFSGALRMHERTTVDQERDVTKILVSEDIKFNSEPGPSGGCEQRQDNTKEKPKIAEPQQPKAPVFSGTLENCVFNFYS